MSEDNHSPQSKAELFILVGDNGSGKSQFLSKLADQFINEKRPVAAIANTVNHRFRRRREGLAVHAPSSIGSNPERLMKDAFIKSDGEFKNIHQIATALEYCGFAPCLHVRIDFANRRYVDPGSMDEIRFRMESTGLSKDHIEEALERLYQFRRLAYDGINVAVDFGAKGHLRASTIDALSVLASEGYLKRGGIIKGIRISVERNGARFSLNDASSGEISLVSTYAFLATSIEHGTAILVDEPENSLHPHWQKEYCKRMLDLFYLYEPILVVATHSPIVVSAATADAARTEVLRIRGGEIFDRTAQAESVEGTLWESFDTLAPANHWLSESLALMLDRLASKKMTLDDVKNEVREFSAQSYAPAQQRFLEDFLQLAERISISGDGREQRP